jgi:hypothetical protein
MGETNYERAMLVMELLGLCPDEDDIVAAYEKQLDAAEQRGFERGRAEERRDVVAWFRETYDGTFEHHVFEQIASDLESAAHLPAKETP